MKKNTAVLIFANSSEKELIEKSIPSSFQLFEKLNTLVQETVRKTGLPYFLMTENEQIGSSFGERFTNAIQQIFDKGYENIISIGNDTPQLSAAHLQKANHLLSENKIVLGPSRDGGFYLMGIHRSLFKKEQFLKLSWQTRGLVKCVERLIYRSGASSCRLETLQDIDTSEDLRSILHVFGAISSEIRTIIVHLLKSNFLFFKKEENLKKTTYAHCFYNKGSPIILHY